MKTENIDNGNEVLFDPTYIFEDVARNIVNQISVNVYNKITLEIDSLINKASNVKVIAYQRLIETEPELFEYVKKELISFYETKLKNVAN